MWLRPCYFKANQSTLTDLVEDYSESSIYHFSKEIHPGTVGCFLLRIEGELPVTAFSPFLSLKKPVGTVEFTDIHGQN